MAKTNLVGLGERLKMARTRIVPEVTQKDAGKVVGRSGPCIGQWELGHSEPGLVDLITLADFYGVAVDWLMGLDSPAAKEVENTMLAVRGVGANSVPVQSSVDIISDSRPAPREFVQAGRAYHSGMAFAWRVDTDAMARFANGDIAIIERGEEPAPGGIFMIRVKDTPTPTLRRCRVDQGRPLFVPDATGFDSYNGQDVEIIGRLREIIKHIPIE